MSQTESLSPPPSTVPLSLKGLTKRWGDKIALDSVDLEIRAGEIFALLGPNGAGKTTLIGCVTGLVKPTAGTATVFGHDTIAEFRTSRRLVGLVPQEVGFDPFFTPHETLMLQMGLMGVPADAARADAVLRTMALLDKRDAYTRTLSGGMKRRLLVAKALIDKPKLLFLDEPTAGVDVELRRDLWDEVCRLRDQGTTVILTTHYLEEAERLADRVGFICRGRLLAVETMADLRERYPGRTLESIYVERIHEADPTKVVGMINLLGMRALLRKEVMRFSKVWMQTVLSPLVTTALYFVVFGVALGARLQSVPVGSGELRYMEFVIPGLMMLAMINNAFLNFGIQPLSVQDQWDDSTCSPRRSERPRSRSYTVAASLRGIIVGALVWVVGGLFAGFSVVHPLGLLLLASLVAATFGLLGLTAAVLSEKFDHLNIVPSFVLTPLTFLGGVFYSAAMLPEPWSTIARLNPIFHMVSGMRWALLGVGEIPVATTFGLATLWFVAALGSAWRVFESSPKLRP